MKYVFLFFFIAIVFSVSAQINTESERFFIVGKYNGEYNGYIRLIYTDCKGQFHTDSTKVINRSFRFEGCISEPTVAAIQIHPNDANNENNIVSFFLEANQISINLKPDSFRYAKIAGSKTQVESEQSDSLKGALLSKRSLLEKEYDSVNHLYRNNKNDAKLKTRLDSIRNRIETNRTEIRTKDIQFITKHSSSFVSGYLLRYQYPNFSLDSVNTLINILSPAVQNSRPINYIHNEFKRAKNGVVGTNAKPFVTKDVNGNTIALSQFLGKHYLILDFWASWCAPCRRGHASLLEIYNKYRKYGLDVIGIASDNKSEDDWRNAITTDSIQAWIQVLSGRDNEKIMNGEYNENDLTQSYNVSALPTLFLIDTKGKILNRYEGDDHTELDIRLSELMSK